MSTPLYRQEIAEDAEEQQSRAAPPVTPSRRSRTYIQTTGSSSSSHRQMPLDSPASPRMTRTGSQQSIDALDSMQSPSSPRIARRGSQQSIDGQSAPPRPVRRGSQQSAQSKKRAPGNRAGRRLGPADLAKKQCFICYSSQEEDTATSSPWIHACKCSLLAHEDCLLHWISEAQLRSSANGPPSQRSVKCPQCGSPYQLVQPRSILADMYDYVDDKLDSLAIRGAIGIAAVGIGISSGVYGVYATRTFLGRTEANRVLAKVWPWSYYLNFPLIAPMLILSRTTILDSLLPVLPVSLISFSPLSNSARAAASVFAVPSASSTIILLPWVRLIYNTMRRRLFHYFLSGNHTIVPPSPGILHITRQQEVGPVPPLAPLGREGIDQIPALEDPPQHQHVHAALTLSVHVLSRLVVGALLFPFIAAAGGSLLLLIARKTGWRKLRILLGLESDQVWRLALQMEDWGSSNSGGSSWLRWAGLGNVNTGRTIGTRDPVWWRNIVGGSMFVVLKDAFIVSTLRLAITHFS